MVVLVLTVNNDLFLKFPRRRLEAKRSPARHRENSARIPREDDNDSVMVHVLSRIRLVVV